MTELYEYFNKLEIESLTPEWIISQPIGQGEQYVFIAEPYGEPEFC